MPTAVNSRSFCLSLNQLESFCNVMGRSLRSGQSFLDAARTYARTSSWNADELCRAVDAGESAAEALKRSGDFPEILISMVKVGEASGRLDQTFLRMADYYRELIRSRRVFLQGIVWPILQLVAAGVVLSLLFIALDYLQRKIDVLVPPDLFGLGLRPLQNLAVVWAVGLLLAVVIGMTLWWLRRGRLPGFITSIIQRLPFVGATWKRIATSRFAWALGAAIDAGTDAITAIRLAVKGSGDLRYRAVEPKLLAAVESGESFEFALSSAGVFPPELIQAVAVGESTGQVTECVERLAEDYDQRNALALRRLGQICGLVVSLSVAGLLGGTVVTMYANYLGMVSGALRANSATLDQIRDEALAAIGDDRVSPENPASGARSAANLDASGSENELLQTRDRMVKDFMENNADFKQIESIYSILSRANEMSPNELLDAIGGETPHQKQQREAQEALQRQRKAEGRSQSEEKPSQGEL